MMELRKEYQDVVDANVEGFSQGFRERIAHVALACQALADRPMKELTDAEKYHLWLSVYDGVFGSTRCTNGSEVIDKIIAAFLKKQCDPEVVKFRAARHKADGRVSMLVVDNGESGRCWEWLEPAQEIEVKLP